MRTTFVVVNYNGESYIEQCLRSVLNQTCKKFRVLVVDNASTDSSVEVIGGIMDSSSRVELIRNDKNLGFARAANQALDLISSGFVALLNNDVFLDEMWLEEMLKAARDDLRAGIFSSRIYLMNGRINSTGHVIYRGLAVMERDFLRKDRKGFRQYLGQNDGRDDRRNEGRCDGQDDGGQQDDGDGRYSSSDYVAGACAAASFYRRKLFDDIGLFDEDYFMYNEDVDISLRALLYGWKIRYVPSAIAYHIHSASTGVMSDFSVYHNSRNWVWSVVKNVPEGVLIREMPFFILRNLMSLLYFTMHGRLSIFRSKIDALRFLGDVLEKREKIQRGRRFERFEEYISGFGWDEIRRILFGDED